MGGLTVCQIGVINQFTHHRLVPENLWAGQEQQQEDNSSVANVVYMAVRIYVKNKGDEEDFGLNFSGPVTILRNADLGGFENGLYFQHRSLVI